VAAPLGGGTRWMVPMVVLGAPAMLGFLPVALVGSFWGSVLATAAGLVLGAWAGVRVWQRSGRPLVRD
jgi:hypothetical protein